MRMFDFSRPELRVWANSDSEMQRFESSRLSRRVRFLTHTESGRASKWRAAIALKQAGIRLPRFTRAHLRGTPGATLYRVGFHRTILFRSYESRRLCSNPNKSVHTIRNPSDDRRPKKRGTSPCEILPGRWQQRPPTP